MTTPYLFIIAGVETTEISPGIVLFPTSEDIVSTATNIITASSQFYTIGAVYWNLIRRTQGVDWQFVTPADHPPYTHMIELLIPPSIGTTIQLVFIRWNIQVQKNFIVNSYPMTFSFYNTTIIADAQPPTGQYYQVQYLTNRILPNQQSLLARYPVIYDELLSNHTQYDSPLGFETFRPTGYQVYDTSNNHVYEWNGTLWVDNGAVSNGTKFYIKRDRTIYELSGGSVITLYVVGSGPSALPQVLTYPPFGEGVAFDLYVDGTSGSAPIDYPAAYEIMNSPGGYDPWFGT